MTWSEYYSMRKIILLMGILVMGILVAGCTQSPAATTPAPTAVATTVPGQVSVTSGTISVPVVTPVVIPATGVFVYVNYLGSFSGTYGTADNMLAAKDSGERLYPVDATNGTVSASFSKLDGSAHPIDVKIYRNSTILQNGTSSSPGGKVNIAAKL
jgi:ABC-type transport system substrate-binding protein